jgi:hypothetical protein
MGKIMENWKPVVGYEGLYEVSNSGRLRNTRTGLDKVYTLNKQGNRPFVGLWRNNRIKIFKPHTLVLTAFVGPRPHGMECCHNDGNSWNNRLENLRWDTTRNNQLDRIKHGTSNRGERCAAAKLTEAQVLAIRADTRKQKVIAAEYGVRDSAISRIKSGKRWGHLQSIP